MRSPTFIGIGMQKSGTRWLYEQLRHHPAFRMPPMKEFHFFDIPFPSPKYLGQLERRGMTERFDLAFLERVRSLGRRPDHPIETYLSLFAGTEGHLTGEITPTYAALSVRAIDRIADAIPETKILMMMRDPVTRAWSELNDGVSRGKMDPSCLSDPAKALEILSSGWMAKVSYPGRAYEKWSRRFDVHCVFLEDVKDDPSAALRGVLEFLGTDPQVPSTLRPDHNSKAGRPRAEMPDSLRDMLIEKFAVDMRRAAKLVGGRAREWPKRYGLPEQRDTASLDAEFAARKESGESITFAEFYAETVLGQIRTGASHPTLGAKLKGEKDWASAGRKKFEKLTAISGTPTRVVDYGCGSLRVGHHFIRTLEAGSYLGLDVIDAFYTDGLQLLGPEIAAEKQPFLGRIGDPVSEQRMSTHGADLVFASAVAFHVHPDELSRFALNIQRASAQPGCVVLFDAMIHETTVRYAHRGWAHPLEFYVKLLPDLRYVASHWGSEEVRDGKTMSMQLLEFRRF